VKRTVKDTEIDVRVGELLDMSSIHVGDVTQAFFHEVMKHLLDGNEVHIPGFGTFKVSIRRGKRAARATLNKSSDCHGNSVGKIIVSVEKKYYVSFRRAAAFRDKFYAKYGKGKVEHVPR
jgi:nucleoid DNA-binding protein